MTKEQFDDFMLRLHKAKEIREGETT